MQLGHLLTCSGLTRLEVSVMVSCGFFCTLVRSFSVFSVICYGAFCLHVATSFFCIPVFCPKLGLYLFLCNLCVLYSVQIYPAVFHIYFISAALILLVCLALMAQFRLLYNKPVSASVLYNFSLVFLKVFFFFGINILFIMPVIFR